MKRLPQKAMVTNEQEYRSGCEESEDEGEQVGMAALAIGVIPSSWILSSPLQMTRKVPPNINAVWPRVHLQR